MTLTLSRVELSEGRRYEVVSDGVRSYDALVIGRITDDLGAAPAAGLALQVDNPRLRVWLGDGGWFGLAGDPALALGDTSIAQALACTVQAPGYRPFTASIALPAHPTFPVSAAPLALRRMPLRLQGRVTNLNTQLPVAGASIDLSPAGPAPHALLLRTPLALPHAAGSVQGVTLSAAALAPPRIVAADALPEATRIKVNLRAGFAVGQLLQLCAVEAAQFVEVAAVSPDPDAPGPAGVIELRLPLVASVTSGAPVLAFSGAPSGGVATLQRGAEAGEAVLALSAVPSERVVRLVDAPRPDEYRAVGALSDAAGRWQANGVAYPAVLRLQPAAGGFPLQSVQPWQLDFGLHVNVIDIQLKP